jgi:hypothetical protein
MQCDQSRDAADEVALSEIIDKLRSSEALLVSEGSRFSQAQSVCCVGVVHKDL